MRKGNVVANSVFNALQGFIAGLDTYWRKYRSLCSVTLYCDKHNTNFDTDDSSNKDIN